MVRLVSLAKMSLAYMQLDAALPSSPVPEQAVRALEETYGSDPYAFSAFRLGIVRALQGNAPEARRLWDEAPKLSWGDSLSTELYTPFVGVLRSQSGPFEDVRRTIQGRLTEGRAGVLEHLEIDAELTLA